MNELLQLEFEQAGGSVDLMNRLLSYNKKGLYAWLVRKVCAAKEGDKATADQRFKEFVEIVDGEINFYRVRYYYYSYPATPGHLLKKAKNYKTVMSVLNYAYPHENLWESIASTCWRECVLVATETYFEYGTKAADIQKRLGLTEQFVYRVRRQWLDRKTIKEE